MTNRGDKLSQARETVQRTREALERNVGTISEQDWREALSRAKDRLREVERNAR